jgi:hypothetical protein
MPDWTDLNAWMAACWKLSWNVDPLPLSVPLSLAELPPDVAVEVPLDEPPLGAELLLDEEHAPRVSVNATAATPAAAACFLYRSCIFSTPFSGRNERSLGRPVSL